MSGDSKPGLNSGLAFVFGILIIVSGIFTALVINSPDDSDEGDENPWEPTPYYPYITPLFSGVIAEHFVEKQLDFGYRVPGTEEHAACRDFIRDTMEEFGYSTEYQEFIYNGTQGTNIIARRSVSEIYQNDTDSTKRTGGTENRMGTKGTDNSKGKEGIEIIMGTKSADDSKGKERTENTMGTKSADDSKDTEGTENIMGTKSADNSKDTEGTNDTNLPQTLILGAHYDTRPYTGIYPLVNKPIMGANDGASGVAVLLELARVMAVHPVNLNLEFVFFDFEDSGRMSFEYAQGSKIYAESLTEAEKESIMGAVVVDMIGDKELDIYYEKNSDPDMIRDIWREADKLDYNEFHHSEKFNMFDDHIRLINVGVPAVLLIDFDYPYWHTQNDTLDKVSGDSLEKVGRVLERYIYSTSHYQRERAVPGDITVEANSTLTLADGVFHVNGNIEIMGTMIIENAFLIVNCEEEYEHLLNITEHGRLEVKNSIVTAPQRALKFETYGELAITNSTIEQLWGNTQTPPFEGGVQLYSPDFRIKDSTIRFSETRGVFIQNVRASNSPAIESCRIIHNGEVGLYNQYSTLEVTDTLLEENGRGNVRVVGGGITLKDSELGICIPEGSCTTGSCSGPEPTYGVELVNIEGTALISGTDFSGMEKGIVGSYIDDSGGSLTIDSITMDSLYRGIELLHASAVIRDSLFNDSGIAISFQSSEPRIENNTITSSLTAILSLTSSGNISLNEIRHCEYYGIYLDRSSLTIVNNSVSHSLAGVHITRDRGSTLKGNFLHENTYGLYMKIQEDFEETAVYDNAIYGNDWGVYCMGNRFGILMNTNSYQVQDVNNSQGDVWEEREIILKFLNNSADVYVNISRDGKIVYSEIVSLWSHTTNANLTTYTRTPDGIENNYTNFSAEFSSGSTVLEREFDILESSELVIEFPEPEN